LDIKAIAETIKEYVAKALEPVTLALAAVQEKQLKAEAILKGLPTDTDLDTKIKALMDAGFATFKPAEPPAQLTLDEVLKALPVPPAQLTLDEILKAIPAAEPVDIEALKTDILKAVPAPQVIDVEALKADILKALPAPEPVDIEALKADIIKGLPTPPVPEHGKDALDIDILPGIDFEKSYLRGTYATHDGGLWKAHSNTQGARGWECIVKGVKGVTCDFDGERSIKLNVEMTGGDMIERGFSVPVMIYRNVWTEGTYEKGDTVTWAGSLWHCDEPTDLKPGEGKGWTLATKRGRDGKDAKPVVDTSGGVKI